VVVSKESSMNRFGGRFRKTSAALVLAIAALGSGCASKGRTYEPCSGPGDCEPPSGCSEVSVDYGDHRANGALCTIECSETVACPTQPGGEPGACLSFSAGLFTCFQRCTSDDTCPAGYACIDRLPDGAGGEYLLPDAVCLPAR
jgi:hypothetical protein